MAGASVIVSSPSEWLGIFPGCLGEEGFVGRFLRRRLEKCRANSSSNETIHPGSPALDAKIKKWSRCQDNYLAFVQLASVRLWLRLNKSAP